MLILSLAFFSGLVLSIASLAALVVSYRISERRDFRRPRALRYLFASTALFIAGMALLIGSQVTTVVSVSTGTVYDR